MIQNKATGKNIGKKSSKDRVTETQHNITGPLLQQQNKVIMVWLAMS